MKKKKKQDIKKNRKSNPTQKKVKVSTLLFNNTF